MGLGVDRITRRASSYNSYSPYLENELRINGMPSLVNDLTNDIVRRLMSIVLLAISWLFLGFGSPATAQTEEPASTTPDYRIAAEDVLDISVWREPDLQKEVIVRPDGGISMPLVGNITAAGLTTAELEDALRSRLSAYIPDAVVTVSVLQLRGLRIYVTGQVRSPGQFEVGRYIDVLQAITLAGGFTPFANTGKVQVIRREGGQETVYKFNYKQFQKGRDLTQNIQLKTDDVVLVP